MSCSILTGGNSPIRMIVESQIFAHLNGQKTIGGKIDNY